jgi:hypothetical protein
MIRYLLDTGVTSQVGKRKPNKNALKWLASVNDDQLAISVITLRERLEGAESAKQADSPSASDIAADAEDPGARALVGFGAAPQPYFASSVKWFERRVSLTRRANPAERVHARAQSRLYFTSAGPRATRTSLDPDYSEI